MRPLRTIVLLFFTVLIALPLSLVATVVLFPVWTWLEANAGIESIGHSGPATWCFVVTFLLVAAVGCIGVLRRGYRAPRQ